MPIEIGAKPESSLADPIGLLTGCHRRIERFLSVLLRVSTSAGDSVLIKEEHTALEVALIYFREAAPKVAVDGEEPLFAHPRSLDHPEVQAIKARFDAPQQQHSEAKRSHAETDRLERAWLATGRLSPADPARLSTLVAELAELHPGQIAVEEGEVFQVAAAQLGEPEGVAIGGVMAAHRSLGQNGAQAAPSEGRH
jgi:hypothetical protein